MSRAKGGAKMFGGLICIGLAEMCRRASFIAPTWEGEITPEKLLSAVFEVMAYVFFASGVWLFYHTAASIHRARLRRERAISRRHQRLFRRCLAG